MANKSFSFDVVGFSPYKLRSRLDTMSKANPDVQVASKIHNEYRFGNRHRAMKAYADIKRGRYGERAMTVVPAVLRMYNKASSAESDRIRLSGCPERTLGVDYSMTLDKIKEMARAQHTQELAEKVQVAEALKMRNLIHKMRDDATEGKFGPEQSAKILNVLNQFSEIEKAEKELEEAGIEINELGFSFKKAFSPKKMKKFVRKAKKVTKVLKPLAKIAATVYPPAGVALTALEAAEKVMDTVDTTIKTVEEVKEGIEDPKKLLEMAEKYGPDKLKEGMDLIKRAKELDPAAVEKLTAIKQLAASGEVKAINTMEILQAAKGVQNVAASEAMTAEAKAEAEARKVARRKELKTERMAKLKAERLAKGKEKRKQKHAQIKSERKQRRKEFLEKGGSLAEFKEREKELAAVRKAEYVAEREEALEEREAARAAAPMTLPEADFDRPPLRVRLVV